MNGTIVLDLTHGEAATVLAILTQRSEQTACPLIAKGSIIRGRPTINVTLKSPGTKDALRQEYNAGRVTCIKEHRDHDTEHFHFEWAIQLTAYNTPECEGSVVISYSLVNANQCNNINGAPKVYSAEASGLQGCIVTLYSNVDCNADQGELFLDVDDECDTDANGFNVGSYEVNC